MIKMQDDERRSLGLSLIYTIKHKGQRRSAPLSPASSCGSLPSQSENDVTSNVTRRSKSYAANEGRVPGAAMTIISI